MTPRGLNKLKEELQKLKAQRPELAEAIAAARAHGDLSENADYDAARNASGLAEAKIRALEASISSVQVINPLELGAPDKVCFGVTIKLEDVDSGEQKVYSIYGSEESDVARGWISFDTPLARALMNKKVGDTATVQLPAGKKEYEIVDIYIDYSS